MLVLGFVPESGVEHLQTRFITVFTCRRTVQKYSVLKLLS